MAGLGLFGLLLLLGAALGDTLAATLMR